MRIEYEGMLPRLHQSVRMAQNATAVGAVHAAERVSIWYGAVLRADADTITIGAESNIQDNAVLHTNEGRPITLGRGVSVGHAAVLHGCAVEDGCMIGMGAVLLDGCVIGEGSLVGAGALVTQNTVVPAGSLVLGAPARVVRPLRAEERVSLAENAEEYLRLSKQLPRAEEQA